MSLHHTATLPQASSSVSVVPEPETLVLLLAGLATCAVGVRCRSARQPRG